MSFFGTKIVINVFLEKDINVNGSFDYFNGSVV